MYKIYKLNVVGNEFIYINTKTGEITGKTYNAKNWIKRNFDASWNKEKKCWIADPNVIVKELENVGYYQNYISDVQAIAEECTVASGDAESATESSNNIRITNAEEDVIVSKKLVNKPDGFYSENTHKSGKITYSFIG